MMVQSYTYLFLPVGIQVKIGPQYPLFFVEKDKMSGPSDEIKKTEARVTAGVAR